MIRKTVIAAFALAAMAGSAYAASAWTGGDDLPTEYRRLVREAHAAQEFGGES